MDEPAGTALCQLFRNARDFERAKQAADDLTKEHGWVNGDKIRRSDQSAPIFIMATR